MRHHLDYLLPQLLGGSRHGEGDGVEGVDHLPLPGVHGLAPLEHGEGPRQHLGGEGGGVPGGALLAGPGVRCIW